MNLQGAKTYMIDRLRSELNPRLYYHSVDHTLDVYESAKILNQLENIHGREAVLIETAAIFHDTGMLVQYTDHESASVTIAKDILPVFGYTWHDIDEISKLIMVTKLPQRPANLLEQILCDADLDYLGREDYLIHAFKLKVEWQVNNFKPTTLKEWFDIQIQFLGKHSYFTPSADQLRTETKKKNLKEIIQLIELC